jgi:hypothetical protein
MAIQMDLKNAMRAVFSQFKIIRQIFEYRWEFGITCYELFSLRDANSGNPDIFHQFGIMDDQYNPKPAFFIYQKLISELTR